MQSKKSEFRGSEEEKDTFDSSLLIFGFLFIGFALGLLYAQEIKDSSPECKYETISKKVWRVDDCMENFVDYYSEINGGPWLESMRQWCEIEQVKILHTRVISIDNDDGLEITYHCPATNGKETDIVSKESFCKENFKGSIIHNEQICLVEGEYTMITFVVVEEN